MRVTPPPWSAAEAEAAAAAAEAGAPEEGPVRPVYAMGGASRRRATAPGAYVFLAGPALHGVADGAPLPGPAAAAVAALGAALGVPPPPETPAVYVPASSAGRAYARVRMASDAVASRLVDAVQAGAGAALGLIRAGPTSGPPVAAGADADAGANPDPASEWGARGIIPLSAREDAGDDVRGEAVEEEDPGGDD